MKQILATLLLLLTLSLPCLAVTEHQAISVVVDTLRVRLIQSDRWREWDRTWADYWNIYDVRGVLFGPERWEK